MQHEIPEDPPDEVLEEQAKQQATRRKMWNNLLHPDPRDPDHEPVEAEDVNSAVGRPAASR